MKAELMRNIFLGAGSRLARYVPNESPRQMVKESVAHLHQPGCLLLLFPEGTRTRAMADQPPGGERGIDRQARGGAGSDLDHRDRLAFPQQGMAAVPPPAPPIVYRVRLGKRFDPPENAAAFTEELERYYRQELDGALQASWLKKPAP